MALQHKSESSLVMWQEEGRRRWVRQRDGISTISKQQTFSSHLLVLLQITGHIIDWETYRKCIICWKMTCVCIILVLRSHCRSMYLNEYFASVRMKKRHFWWFIFRLLPSPPSFSFSFTVFVGFSLAHPSRFPAPSLVFPSYWLPIGLLKAQALDEMRLTHVSSCCV